MKRVRSALIWYLKGGLFHPLYIFLAILPTLLLFPYLEDPMFDMYLIYYVDIFISPLAALMVALHLCRESRITVFEISMFRSLRIIFIARIMIYLLALSIMFIPLTALLMYSNKTQFLLPLMQKLLMFISISTISFILDTSKGVLMYLIIFLIMLPYAPPILLNMARSFQYKPNVLVSTICYFISPITTSTYTDIITTPLNDLATIASVISIAIIILSYIVFSRKEFEI